MNIFIDTAYFLHPYTLGYLSYSAPVTKETPE